MISLSEQLSLAAKAFFEAQMASAAAFAQVALDCGASMIDLNVDAAKSSMAAAAVAANQWLAVRDVQGWMSMTNNQSQLALQRATAYGRQAADFVQGSRARFAGVAETQGAASRQKGVELADMAKQAPAAAITPINTFLKSAFDNAQAGYDQMARAGQQAVANLAVMGQPAR